jgi:transposase
MIFLQHFCFVFHLKFVDMPQKLLTRGQIRLLLHFLHDNARPHTSKMTKKKLEDLDWEVLPHAPYSPDKAPSDFHLFRSLKNWLKGRRFEIRNEVRMGVQAFFEFKDVELYKRGINGLVDRWEQIIAHDGDYCD